MPRRKQLNPQPVKLDSEDGVAVADPASLVLDSDFLLGRELQFGENDVDHKLIGLEKETEDSADIGIGVFPLCDEDCPSFTPLSMESQADDPRDTESEREEGGVDLTLPPYLSCGRCGQLLTEALGEGLHHGQPYCARCGEGGSENREGADADPASRGNGNEDEGGVYDDVDGPPKLHSCKLCSFSSRYSNHVKRHMKTHNGEKPYRCPLCAYASAQLVNLQRHLRIHTGEKPYKCEHCTFACSSLGNLKRHQRMHTPHKCTHNEYRPSSSSLGLERPVIGHQPSRDEPGASAEDPATSDPALHATNNGDYLQSYSSLRADREPPSLLGMREGAGADSLPELLFPFTCRLCGLVLDDEDGASAQICSRCTLDMLSKDSPDSLGEKSDRAYSCALCSFTTHYPNHLARHMKTHSGEKPYKCPQCDYASAHFDNLKRHHRVHTGEKPYKCHLCDYACGNLANLKRHQRIHSGAKPFKCAVCHYSCNQSMNLKRHMLRHTGEKPFKCQECPYTTGHWDNYKRHQKKHGHSTDGWVKVQLPDNEEEEEEDEEEDE